MHFLTIPLMYSFASFRVTAFPAPGPFSDVTIRDIVAETDECNLKNLQQIIYNSTLTQFDDLFKSPDRPKCYHWCTNGCSWSPDSFPYDLQGNKVSWKPACARHDFSWHNLKRYGAFNEENKLQADNQLRNGMLELCGPHKVCAEISKNLYYPVVRLASQPASEHAEWEADAKTDCTIFPGCCANHSDGEKCGEPNLLGQYKGDMSCMAQ
ncbi:hypothetical protein EJ08DRAFT_7618 [Tothia fuscella]|uniref:Uncharacterized protein n=1 Tax=Tothia fuscella TaxID=1048955 RepID=A0A9P4P5G8_9PEZI|nr:hypothetical protein EJ08DRAFT_7618 [Tothia fuscella]